ncbi:hypothetical protein [Ensifer adhaerens]|uniref:hypothetical protein n=1 Tax=Ensifer adhaerens TaxID=106592 RepID=UPI000CF06500|nr:hypothetical protein [Ensifer adhaerens]
MTEKTALWDKLGKTDPKHTKDFTRGGGFRGTAIKPMFSYRRMTEEFGPCGQGWGIGEPSFQVVIAGEETLVYCTVSIWYEKREQTVFGVGGDKVAGKNKYGVQTDDEAFKKAFTDAVTNALKLIGVGADVHMGMFDDSKYVNTLKNEFAEQKTELPPPANDKPKSSAQLKRDGEFERVRDQLANDMVDVHTFAQFEKVKEHYRADAKKNGWNNSFLFGLSELFGGYEQELTAKIEAENALMNSPLAAGE